MPSVTIILFWLSYVAGTCAALFNPIAGVVLYILVYHLNPETQWWGSSIRALGLRTSMTVALATGLGILIRRPRFEYGAQQFQTSYVLALLLGLFALGSLAWGLETSDRGLFQAEKYVKLMIFLFILIRCVRTPLHYQLVCIAWLIGVAYLGYQACGGAGRQMGGRLAYGIGGPDFADSSGLAVHLVATLPLIGAMFFMFRSWLGRVFVLATGAMVVNTIVMTRTRNAIVGLGLIAFVGLLSLPRGYRLRGFFAVVIGAVLALQLTDPGWWRRMQTISEYRQDASAIQRIKYWKAAIQMANDYPTGIGLGNYRYYVRQYVPGLEMRRSAHSTYATCVAELGWVGLGLFLAIIISALLRLRRIRRAAATLPTEVDIHLGRWRGRFHIGWHTMALHAGLIGYLGCAAFTTRLFAEDLWIFIGLTMCLQNVTRYVAGTHATIPAPSDTTATVTATPVPEEPRHEPAPHHA